MKIGQAFPSKYLKSSDIPEGKFVTVLIDHVQTENVAGNDNPDDEKPVIYFIGKSKGMVLNKTNANTVMGAYGDETEDWHGKPILLYQTDVSFQGKMVPSLRIKIQKTPAAGQQNGNRPAPVRQQPVPVAASRAEFDATEGDLPVPPDDDIPF